MSNKRNQIKTPWQASNQMPSFQRTNSSFRLSRTSTNTNTIEPYYDNQSLRTLDKIPSAKPSVTYLDKLWTQIDVLDDVKTMSNQVKEKGSFFNDQFNEELNRLKRLQEKLVEVMATQQANNKGVERPKPRYKHDHNHNKQTAPGGANLDESDEEVEAKSGKSRVDSKQKFKDFFGERYKTTNNVIYKKQNFDDVNSYVNEVKQNLEDVSQAMKNFDDTTRDLW